MHNIEGDWAGSISGTNNAEIFVEIRQDNTAIFGKARINDRVFGIYVYPFTGKIDGGSVFLYMKPESTQKVTTASVSVSGRPVTVQVPTLSFGDINVQGKITKSGISGKWESSLGTGGVFSIARSDSVKKIALDPDNQRDQVFLMMPIAAEKPELKDILNAVKRSSKQYGLDCIRVDEIEHTGRITDLILSHIDCSRYLVCDISTERPNVYYELGYAHGLGKEVILIAREGSNIHFDIKDYSIIFYKSITELEERLSKRIETIRIKHKGDA